MALASPSRIAGVRGRNPIGTAATAALHPAEIPRNIEQQQYLTNDNERNAAGQAAFVLVDGVSCIP